MSVLTFTCVVPTPVSKRVPGSLGEGTWMEHGLCRQVDPDLFFPAEQPVGPGRDNGMRSARLAKQVCSMCPVKTLCLEYAIRYPQDMDGVWGGLTRTERRELRRAWRGGEEEAA